MKAGRREWIGLGVIALPCMLYAMDLTVLNLALPALSQALKPSAVQLLWIVDIYGFLVAGALIPMGALGDRIGRRKLLLWGAGSFAVASVIAAFSTSAAMLIATRAILGFAGATLAPSTLSLIRNMFLDAEERTFAIGIWITSYSIGGAIGPLLGGFLLQHFWWGSVFLLSVPVMAVLLILGPILLPEYRDPGTTLPDITSALLSLASVLAVIYGIKRLAEYGFAGWPFFVIALGLLMGWIFIHRQKKLKDPLIHLHLFNSSTFSVSLTIYMLSTFVAFGFFVYLAQYLQLVVGLSPLRAGLWMLPSFIGFTIGSMICPQLVRKIAPAYLMAAGLVMAAVGYGLMCVLSAASGPVIFMSGLGLYSLGLAPAFTLTTDFIVGAAPPEGAGAASAISETSSELGGALGVAILGSAGAALYRRAMAAVPIIGIPTQAIKEARETLGGAVAAAQQLPPAQSRVLLEHATAAFMKGLHLAVMINITMVVLLAVLAVIQLPKGSKATP